MNPAWSFIKRYCFFDLPLFLSYSTTFKTASFMVSTGHVVVIKSGNIRVPVFLNKETQTEHPTYKNCLITFLLTPLREGPPCNVLRITAVFYHPPILVKG